MRTTPERHTVVRTQVTEARTALERGAFDSAILCPTGTDQLKCQLAELRGYTPDLLIVVCATPTSAVGEDEAFTAGADLFFSADTSIRTLQRVLERTSAHTRPPAPRPPEPEQSQAVNNESSAAAALQTIRNFSQVLGFSLDYKAFTQQFILKLRDHISFSRIGIFLESSAKQALVKKSETHQLKCIASIGLPNDLIECFQLNRQNGIGKSLREQARIIHAQHLSDTAFGSDTNSIRKELDILGCHIAVPITDRESLIGVAVLNGPVTGRDFNDDELQLLFILMEELGLAIRNSRLHAELASHGQLIESVMSSMASGAIVVSESLNILYTNRSAREFLAIHTEGAEEVQWAHLPTRLAVPLHRAVEKGELPEPFLIPGNKEGEVYRISIIPFTQENELLLLPRPAMVVVEDFTNIEASKETALMSSRNELISLIAKRFAHEIRNSLVPLSTHAQLIDKKIDNPAFQASLKSALLNETSRIKRFSEQMLYLSQEPIKLSGGMDLRQQLSEGFERAKKHLHDEATELDLRSLPAEDPLISGDSESLAYAFEELFLNALQVQEAASGKVHVTIESNLEGILRLRIRDNGPGFPADLLEQATEPFFTTRNTGVGLGLAVTNKIISEHNGFMRINARSPECDWDIEIELPALLTHNKHV